MDHEIAVAASEETIDARVARMAAIQHGVISRSQAVAAGASRGLIDQRVATRRWPPMYPGVYVLPGTPPSWRRDLMAACLAAGRSALASHRAAAALERLPGGEQRVVELSVPNGRRVRLRGLIVHHVAPFERVDVTVVDAIPVTTPTRTLIDLASVVSADVLEEALDDALRRRLTSVNRLRWRLDHLGTRGRPGAGRLEKLVASRARATVPESPLETRFLRLLRRAKLPLPVSQFEVRDGGKLIARVDFAYPDLRLAIEVDSYRWHSSRARWERDLARRNALTALGWRVIHVTSTDLDERSGEIVAMIAGALVDGSARRSLGGFTKADQPRKG